MPAKYMNHSPGTCASQDGTTNKSLLYVSPGKEKVKFRQEELFANIWTDKNCFQERQARSQSNGQTRGDFIMDK